MAVWEQRVSRIDEGKPLLQARKTGRRSSLSRWFQVSRQAHKVVRSNRCSKLLHKSETREHGPESTSRTLGQFTSLFSATLVPAALTARGQQQEPGDVHVRIIVACRSW